MNLPDVDGYLRSLRDRLATVQEEGSASEKVLLASNVFEQIQEHIPTLATHQVLSKYLERLIVLLAHSLIEDPTSEFDEKHKLCRALVTRLIVDSDVEVLSKDIFGSHVLQSALQCLTLFEHNGVALEEPLQSFAITVEDKCLFELLHHTSGSHVLRSLVKALAGVLDAGAFQKSKRKNADREDALLPSKNEISTWRIKRLKRWLSLFCKDLNGVMVSSQACAALCLLLKLCQDYSDTDTALMAKEVTLHCLEHCMESKTASFAAEQCIKLCQNAEFNEAFKKSVLPHAQVLCENMYGNYVVQAMINHQYFRESHLEGLLHSLHIERILQGSSASVVWRLCESAVILGSCQSLFLKKLMEALCIIPARNGVINPKVSGSNLTQEKPKYPETGDDESKHGHDNDGTYEEPEGTKKGHIWLALASCQPVKSESIRLRATGSSILLNLLKFERKLIEHIIGDFKHFLKIAKSQGAMKTLATDRHFSRVLQLMLDPRQGLLKEKEIIKLFKHLKSELKEIALDINGAFVLSSLFKASTVTHQRQLLVELAQEAERIQRKNKRFADIIGLDTFKKNEELWMNKRKKSESVRNLFKDIVDPSS